LIPCRKKKLSLKSLFLEQLTIRIKSVLMLLTKPIKMKIILVEVLQTSIVQFQAHQKNQMKI
jgi:hypothetical protein